MEESNKFRLRNEENEQEQQAAVNTVKLILEEFEEAEYETREIEAILKGLKAKTIKPGEAIIKAHDLRRFMGFDVSHSKAS